MPFLKPVAVILLYTDTQIELNTLNMIRKYLLGVAITALLALCTQTAKGQGLSVNTTGDAADTSAMLDVSSSSKGLLMPRMTSAQRDAIHLPASGLMVYVTDGTPGLYLNNGTPAAPAWTPIATDNPGSIVPFSATLNSVPTGTDYYIELFGLSGPAFTQGPIPGGVINPLLSAGDIPGIFTVPKNGTITSVSASFVNGPGLSIPTTITPIIYVAAPNSTFYQQLPLAMLTPITFAPGAYRINTSVTPTNIAVAAGSTILVGFYIPPAIIGTATNGQANISLFIK